MPNLASCSYGLSTGLESLDLTQPVLELMIVEWKIRHHKLYFLVEKMDQSKYLYFRTYEEKAY